MVEIQYEEFLILGGLLSPNMGYPIFGIFIGAVAFCLYNDG
jgi:hypothetical protein